MFKLVTNLIIAGLVLFNTYNSFKSRRLEKHIRIQYSHYFKIMSIFLALDNIFSSILSFIPFYQVSRLLMVIWLSVPMCSGAAFVYRFYINGFFRVYEQDLDQYISSVKETISNHFLHCYNYANLKYREGRKRKEILDASQLVQSKSAVLMEEEPKKEVEMGITSRVSVSHEKANEEDEVNDDVSNVSEDNLKSIAINN